MDSLGLQRLDLIHKDSKINMNAILLRVKVKINRKADTGRSMEEDVSVG